MLFAHLVTFTNFIRAEKKGQVSVHATFTGFAGGELPCVTHGFSVKVKERDDNGTLTGQAVKVNISFRRERHA